jgi:hypothetical protein
MGVKGKLTNKQVSAMGIDKIDNGKNLYEQGRKEKQRKNDNVKAD